MKRKSYRRKTKRGTGFNKKVLAVIKRTAEPKKIHINLATQGSGPTSMYHNSFNTWKIFDMASNKETFPIQGDGIGQRNGQEIYGKGFMLRASFGIAGDRRGTTLRFYLVTPINGTTTVDYARMFENITNSVALDPLDKNTFPTTKFLGTYKIPDVSAPTMSVDGTNELIDSKIMFKKWIPFNRKINFLLGDNREPSNVPNSMQLVVTVYDHNSALETDICVKSIDIMSSFYYSDP
jgi:hypothetical protein